MVMAVHLTSKTKEVYHITVYMTIRLVDRVRVHYDMDEWKEVRSIVVSFVPHLQFTLWNVSHGFLDQNWIV